MSKRRNILVLEVIADELRISHLGVGGDPIDILDTFTFRSASPSGDQTVLEDQTVLDALSRVVAERGWVGKEIIWLIGGGFVSCQYFTLPPLKGSALRQAVMLKLRHQLHFDINEAIVDIKPVKSAQGVCEGTSQVAVTAIQQDIVQLAMAVAERLKLRVASISAVPMALAALAQSAQCDAEGYHALFHVGSRLSTFIVLDGATPCVASEVPIGLADFVTALMRPIITGEDVIQLDEDKALSLRSEVGIPNPDQHIESLGITGSNLLPLLEPALQKMAQQLTQWLSFATTLKEGRQVSRLSVVGPGAAMPGLSQALEKRIGLDVKKLDWLKGRATFSSAAKDVTIDSVSAAIGAALNPTTLPDLIPSSVRKERKIQRIRRATTLMGPVVAAAILACAFLYERVDGRIQPLFGSHRETLAHMQQTIRKNQKWVSVKQDITRLRAALDQFERETPHWMGIFKELSRNLPEELKVTECAVDQSSGVLHMTLQAKVHPRPQGRSFEVVVEKTLSALEQSPFFKRVQIMETRRIDSGEGSPDRGIMSVELDLSYPHSNA